jgi:formate dehydrogenase maturation protein FdhE
MNETKWNQRIRRAADLASAYPFAAEGLRFYERVAQFQKNFYGEIQKSLEGAPKISAERPLRDELDLFLLLPGFPGFLRLIHEIAPQPLALLASEAEREGPTGWQNRIEKFWLRDSAPTIAPNLASSGERADTASTDDLLAWLFLQPYAEYLADHRESAQLHGTPSLCPMCGFKPIVGVLRAEGDGAKKSLICMLCAHEWAFRRIYCPACGEERESHMAFYSAPEIPHIRVDVCETCRTYTKSVDLTKFGLAVPVVDELAALPLDLWARENGYHKLQINVVGI